MSRILLAVNTLTSVGSQAYASHLSLIYRLGRDTEDEFILYNGNRCGIDRFRNQAGEFALHYKCDYLMFIDDDVLVSADTYVRLKKSDKDVITPLVYIRGYPFNPMMFVSKDQDGTGIVDLVTYNDWEEKVKESGESLLPCAAIGFSCCLIKSELLTKVTKPWFITGVSHTEDVYFCVKARSELKNEVSIYVDTSLHAAHMLDPEFIEYRNRDALLAFYESVNPDLRKERDANRRSDNSVEGIIEDCTVECTDGSSSAAAGDS